MESSRKWSKLNEVIFSKCVAEHPAQIECPAHAGPETSLTVPLVLTAQRPSSAPWRLRQVFSGRPVPGARSAKVGSVLGDGLQRLLSHLS